MSNFRLFACWFVAGFLLGMLFTRTVPGYTNIDALSFALFAGLNMVAWFGDRQK